ncbi:hypothetical protein COU76_01375 [Candidatus Peregrinibacteria bacterium CG10_big_fil_rev_8_21_14_0_10_49_10]|nr:MAG: hypothetical protein COU76_01375 [Candidatus Peregrinibacteria bacterium CG10_big_fil_rev_8_21_14_0_10_49_10]
MLECGEDGGNCLKRLKRLKRLNKIGKLQKSAYNGSTGKKCKNSSLYMPRKCAHITKDNGNSCGKPISPQND